MHRCPRCHFGWSLREGHLCRECKARELPTGEELPSLRELQARNQERIRRDAVAREELRLTKKT